MSPYDNVNMLMRPPSKVGGGVVASRPAGTPTGVPQAQSPAQASGNAAGAAPGGIQPTYLSSVFPGGTPQAGVEQSNVESSPGSFLDMITKSLQPQFQQQDRGLQDALANAGIVGGSTAGAFQDLGKQQQSTLQNDLAASLLQSRGQQIGQSEFNAGAANTGDQYNTSNRISTGEFDVANNLTAQGQNMGFANQDWLARLNAQQNYDLAGQGAKNAAYTPIYTQPGSSTSSTGGFASALANFQPKAPTPSPTPTPAPVATPQTGQTPTGQ